LECGAGCKGIEHVIYAIKMKNIVVTVYIMQLEVRKYNEPSRFVSINIIT
jgi:hypothetical protein